MRIAKKLGIIAKLSAVYINQVENPHDLGGWKLPDHTKEIHMYA